MGKTEKIKALVQIAHGFNQADILWCLGASMLLYLKGIAPDFHDIDLLLGKDDVAKAAAALKGLGAKRLPPNPNPKYPTEAFLEYSLSGVDIDIMAGFRIVRDGATYDCSLEPGQIVEHFDLDGERIPLQSVGLWLRYYELMGREDKVAMIKKALGKTN